MKKKSFWILITIVISSALFAAEPVITIQARISADLVTVGLTDSDENKGIKLPGADRCGLSYNDTDFGASLYVKGNFDGTEQELSLDEYFGWFKLGGISKFTFGKFDNRYAERVRQDAGNFAVFGSTDQEFGVYRKNTNDNYKIIIVENIGKTNWEREIAGELTLGDFMLQALTGHSDNTNYNLAEYFAFRIAYDMKNVFNVSADITRNDQTYKVGAYLKSTLLNDLIFVAGYSGLFDTDNDEHNVNAIELRARYTMGAFSVTMHNNLSFGYDNFIRYDMINFAYKLNPLCSVFLYAENKLIEEDDDIIMVSPRTAITVHEKATLSVGPELRIILPETGDTKVTMNVPCVFRIKY